jgi:hypothetical protein
MLGLGLMANYTVVAGLARTPGSKTADLSALTTSRTFKPSPLPDSGAAISIVGGEYSLYSGGIWGAYTSDAGAWGSATRVRVRLTSSWVYLTPASVVLTVGGVEYEFIVTTVGAAYSLQYLFSGDDQLTINDEPLYAMVLEAV